jgi:hypothetical protein
MNEAAEVTASVHRCLLVVPILSPVLVGAFNLCDENGGAHSSLHAENSHAPRKPGLQPGVLLAAWLASATTFPVRTTAIDVPGAG